MATQHVSYVNTESGNAQRSLIAPCFDCLVVYAVCRVSPLFSRIILVWKGKVHKRILFFLRHRLFWFILSDLWFTWVIGDFHLFSLFVCLPFFHLAFSSLSAADGLRLSFALIAVWKQSNDFLVWKRKNQQWHASVWECILRCLWNSGADAFICRWCNYK